MAKVLSIEIGYSLIKIIETDLKTKNPKVYRCANIPTPEGALVDGELNVTDELVARIRNALLSNGMKTKQAVFTITASKIASREVVMPNVKENKISSVVRANASDYFPVDISQYEIAYTPIGMIGEDKESMQRRVMVFAAPRTLLEGYQTLAQQCGLEIAAMDYSGNSILQVIKNECKDGIQMVIKIDERSSILTIMENGQLSLQRSIPYGVDEAIETLMQTHVYGDLEYEQALELLRRKTCVNRTLRARMDIADASDREEGPEQLDEGEQFSMARQQITEALEPLMSGIARVVDFYNSRNYGKQIDKTYLTGLGGDFSGLSKLLTNELGFRIVVLTKAEGFNVAKSFREVSFGEYIACLGAAVAPLGFTAAKEAEKREKGKFELTPLMSVSVLILCLIISIAWFVTAYLPYRQAVADNEYYRGQVNELSTYIPDYLEYTGTKQAYGYLMSAYGQTQLETRYLVSFIEEMEQKMPHAFYISNLNVDAAGFSMNVTVGTKEEAAECIEQLRTFASIASLSVNGIYDNREVVIEDFDQDGVYEVLDRDSEVADALRGGAAGQLSDGIESALQKNVTFSVEGTFSGMGALGSGENGTDTGAGADGTQTGTDTGAGADGTQAGTDTGADAGGENPAGEGNAEQENSDAELESALGEINSGN